MQGGARMRVLEVCDKAGFGGIERIVQTVSDGLVRRGHFVFRLALLRGGPPEFPSLQLAHIGGWRGLYMAANGIRRICRAYGIDVVHSHCGQGMRAVALMLLDRPALVTTIHGYEVRYKGYSSLRRAQLRSEGRLFLRKAHVVYVSDHVAEDYRTFWGTPGLRSMVIPNGVACREEVLDNPSRDIDVLQVGNFYPVKNQLETVAALAWLRQRGHALRAMFAGDGQLRPSAEEMARRAHIQPSVQFCGHVEAYDLYRRARVVVIPSIYESFSLAAVEAWQNGCSVVASDIPAHREIAGKLPGISLYPLGRVELLGRAVEHGLDEVSRSNGHCAMRTLPQPYRAETMIDAYEAVLKLAVEIRGEPLKRRVGRKLELA